ncbi:fungal hydrophobin [Marasmius fiardii PR-910]|nr:fungal hydrophobin [Marasmius fiardii PR-910]
MLFNKLFTISAITTLAAATALPRGGGGSAGGTGPQCCKKIETAEQASQDPVTQELLLLLGVDVHNIPGLIGLNCSPITVIGGGNGACNTYTVDCQGSIYGLVSIGCTWIII